MSQNSTPERLPLDTVAVPGQYRGSSGCPRQSKKSGDCGVLREAIWVDVEAGAKRRKRTEGRGQQTTDGAVGLPARTGPGANGASY
jgi:hypothetical protein